MHVHFRCPNILPDASEERPCGRQLRAPRDKAGRLAKCPQCGSKVKIPSQSDPQFAPVPPAPTFDDSQRATNTEESLNLQVSQDDFDAPILDGAARPGAIDTTRTPKSEGPKSNSRTANFLPLDSASRCRKCGQKTDKRGYCGSCNYSSTSRETATGKPIDAIKIKSTGMQLWMSNVVAEGVPPGILVVVIHCLFAAFTAVALFVVCTSFSGLMFVAALGFVLASAFFYAATVWKTMQFRNDPHTQLAWFQRPFWDGILWYCRRNEWADNKNSKRVVINRRQSNMTNQQLDKVKNLKAASVLDLEGTMITDEAFRYFYRIDDLQCLVLKDTSVSHEAVFRLQQTRPNLWIWY